MCVSVCVCVLLADRTSLDVALGFEKALVKTWRQLLCFL